MPRKLRWKFKTPDDPVPPKETVLTRIQDRLDALPEYRAAPVIEPVRKPKWKRTSCRAMVAKGRRCKQARVFGSTRCVQHQTPATRKQLEARLNTMAEPAIKRLEILAHQSENLNVSMAAVNQILNRTMGAVGKDGEEKDKRPSIRIAIAVGGIPLPQQAVIEMPAELPAPPDDEDDD